MTLETVAVATERRQEAQRSWELALREAARHHSLREIASVAGVSYARVGQIVKEQRGR